jgi:hypothetical protein
VQADGRQTSAKRKAAAARHRGSGMALSRAKPYQQRRSMAYHGGIVASMLKTRNGNEK